MVKGILSVISICFLFFLSCSNIYVEAVVNIKLEMVLIDAAGRQFTMGSNNGETNETPVHTVVFTNSFLISRTEVIQSDYLALLRINPSKYQGDTLPADSLPVDKVSWFDAALFCNALSKQQGYDTVYKFTAITGTPGDNCALKDLTIHMNRNGYRLPTEAEWEYACRAGTTTDFYWGDSDDLDTVSMYCWYTKNSNNKTHPVGTKLPNAWGLYDMSGNLFEWCNDWYGPYADSVYVDPDGPLNGSSKITRGGNWLTQSGFCRASYRGRTAPDFRCSAIGFRVARRL
jgi:formylglycine-generating enzyme required for sulfatase activity